MANASREVYGLDLKALGVLHEDIPSAIPEKEDERQYTVPEVDNFQRATRRIQADEAARARRDDAGEIRLARGASRAKISRSEPTFRERNVVDVKLEILEHDLTQGEEVTVDGDNGGRVKVFGDKRLGRNLRTRARVLASTDLEPSELADSLLGLPPAELPSCGDASLDAIAETMHKGRTPNPPTFGAPTRFDQEQ